MFATSTTTTSFSRSGTFPDKSHYSYTYSYTSFQPCSATSAPYDAFFEEMASRELGRKLQCPLPYGNAYGPLGPRHDIDKVPGYVRDRSGPRVELLDDIDESGIETPSVEQKSSHRGEPRRDSAMSIASSSASSRTLRPSSAHQQRRKVASRANTYPPPLPLPPIPQQSLVSSSSPYFDASRSADSSSERRQQNWALVRHAATVSALRCEVAPEDSISQISSSARRSSAGCRHQYVPPDERRGRTRTRGETWGSAVSGYQQPPSMMMRPVPSGKFETRVITPWD
ncbi:hypothetical protein CERZMDRAFT_99135 [Cercospora zeae-maydis SCOH1-5]|uniref:Uncharacterized protein n=1 Tax=Cercospora zeae-maydis SCOH1-5 TaxID=717836 RepID=A0A6A6FC39_9PEZI|nr:hypothetical protein CERZMDRAFT_99135 [Cercospora zeae-maydis SCOH1-5]